MGIKAVINKYSQRSEESNKALVSIKASIEELKQKVNKSALNTWMSIHKP